MFDRNPIFRREARTIGRRQAAITVAAASVMMVGVAGAAPAAEISIVVQSTTSAQNSGLYNHLLPKFERATGIKVKIVAVGTGQAIRNAGNGDADVLLVHDKQAEEQFVREGNGVERFDVMYNDFVIVGPASDPAGIGAISDAAAALRKIAARRAVFASRGDSSGTHKAELRLWAQAGLSAGLGAGAPAGNWYRATGSGMGATLNIASGMGAYALTDRATWIGFSNKGDLKILVEGDKRLFNQYGVTLVNPARHKHVKANAGRAFIKWLLSKDGQSAIDGYRLAGQQLFFANAGGAD